VWALATISVVLAGPSDDPSAILAGRALRSSRAPVVLGGDDRGRMELALTLPEEAGTPLLDELLAPELAVARGEHPWSNPGWLLRPGGSLGLGDLPPEGGGGDPESGPIALRANVEGAFYAGSWVAELRPVLGLDLDPLAPVLRVPLGWVGYHDASWTVGFGVHDRWIGPGRHGSLMLSDNARPAPLGSVAWRSASDRRWGQARLEVGAGWLDGPRSDVQHPGWLLMDARWAARSWLEIGGTRMAIFGGEGRPAPDVAQLLVPSEPHIYGDPDKTLPDQDELAALDVRVTIPVARLSGGALPLDTVELWWQYGGEDEITRELLGVSVPSLAGVANLYGAELTMGPWTLSGEGADILDDTFRWYTGHRVYHAGFTQSGRAMGYPSGGDSLTGWGALTWLPGDWGGQLSLERRRRVGVIEASGGHVLALATDELSDGLTARIWRRDGPSWWGLSLGLDRVTGLDFVPGQDTWRYRVSLSR